MDRHLACNCGGTAWITRENGVTTIECAKCGSITSDPSPSAAKAEWRQRQAANSPKKPAVWPSQRRPKKLKTLFMPTQPKKRIEVALPLEEINAATLHLWWARRPLAAARAPSFSPRWSMIPRGMWTDPLTPRLRSTSRATRPGPSKATSPPINSPENQSASASSPSPLSAPPSPSAPS